MTENKQIIQYTCKRLHQWFEDDTHDYSEREASDVEYFVGVLMYNHFAFSKALSTMKTMDVGLDFKNAAGAAYKEAYELIGSIKSADELLLLSLLQEHIELSLEKYAGDSSTCYLLQRLQNHIKTLANIYAGKLDKRSIDFERMSTKAGL